ncbi:MAG: NAD(P)H-dependent oxidoreductase subunit E [Bradymonadales bacterium]|jgi:NADH-quinone oxidoreductase subunit E
MSQDQKLQAEAALLQRVREIARSYKGVEGSLIQVLHQAQNTFGYLPLYVQEVIAEEMGVSLPTVAGVVSFYSFFSTQPRGEHTIRLCMGTACYVCGGAAVQTKLTETLGCDVDQTTKDGKFTFEVARCIGACGLAPAMTIGEQVYAKVQADEVAKILGRYYTQAKEAQA